MPRRVTPKRERQYKNIAPKAKKEGRYEGQEEEVAARVVNKQRAKSRATPFVDILIPGPSTHSISCEICAVMS
jgi:hypothetical protein